MTSILRSLATSLFIGAAANAIAGEPAAFAPGQAALAIPIYDRHAIDLESGMLWQVGDNTPIDYRLVPTQLAWRTPRAIGFDFDDGSSLSVRNRFALLGTWVERGPENHYFGLMFSPSIEFWNAEQTWGIYTGAGGGFGWIDSQGVPGGQGRDLTLNWFAHLGVQHVLTDTLSLRLGAMFQHMSNGGATTPNPGIDALGFTVGCSWSF